MASERSGADAATVLRLFVRGSVAAALGVCAVAVWPQPAGTAAGIYTCTDDKGRRLTSDRPIAACAHKEQLLLNRDGSVRAVIPPSYTAEERAEREARERRAAEERAAQADAVRRDRNLIARFPNEAAHAKAREAALEPVRQAIVGTERRIKELAAERAPLVNEAEFYVGKPLPTKIKLQLDANDAATEAQKAAATTQAAELERVNKIYDTELERLRKLWGGAPPGSLGPIPVVGPVAPVKPTGARAPGVPRASAAASATSAATSPVPAASR
jgi:hypothetical protein